MYHYEIGQTVVLATDKFHPFLQIGSIVKVVYRDHKLANDKMHFQYGIKLMHGDTNEIEETEPMYMVQPQDLANKVFMEIPRHLITIKEIPYCRRD